MKKILIADDHQLFTECLVNTLSDVPDIKIVATAQNGKEALEKIKKHNPSIALLDIGMPVIDGFEAAETIKERHPECKVIMLTARDSIEDIETALRAGIKGYVLKNASREELTTAIDTVDKGNLWFSNDTAIKIKDSLINGTPGKQQTPGESRVKLTKRELQILLLIYDELNTKQIASELHIAVNTVETHRKNLFSKFEVKNAIGLTKKARKAGYLK